MDTQRGKMEAIYYALGDMKLTKKQRAKIAGMLRTAFVNGLHTALVEREGVAGETALAEITAQNETVQHIIFLAQENSK